MKIRTLYRLFKWFEGYQRDLSREQGVELYSKLIEEECKELDKALEKGDLEEVLDAIGDILWVKVGYAYFYNTIHSFGYIGDAINEAVDMLYDNIEFVNMGYEYATVILDGIMNAIADSNFTKIKEKRKSGDKKGKVIKGPHFQKPDFKNVIKIHNLKLKKSKGE